MMKVNRELREGATQSPEALNLARERSGGTVVDMPLRMSPLPDPHGMPWLGRHLWGRAGRS